MTPLKRRACLAAGFAALAVTAHVATAEWAAHRLKSQVMATTALHGAVARIGSVSVNAFTGKAVIEGLSVSRGSVTARAGRITHRGAPAGGLIGPALAATSSYTMEDVEIVTDTMTLGAEQLDFQDASIDEDAMQDLFDADKVKDVIDVLKGLSFKSAKSPEITLTMNQAGVEQTASYKNLLIEGMLNGKAVLGRIDSIETEAKTPQGTTKMKTGAYEMTGIDFVVMTRFYGDKPNPGDSLAPALQSSRLTNMSMSLMDAGEMTIGVIESGAVRLKPMAVPFSSLSALGAKKKGEKLNPAESKEVLTLLRELSTSIADDGMEAREIRFTTKGGPAAEARIGRIAFSFGGGKVPAGYRVENIAVNAPAPEGPVSFKLGQFSVEGFSYLNTLEAITRAMEAGDPELKKVDPRTLIPKLGTVTLKGVEIDAPDPKAPKGAPPDRINVKLGNFTASASDQIKGIPTSINLSLDNLAMKLPPNSADPNIKQIQLFGYNAIDVSAKVGTKWDEAKKELSITDVSVGGVDMGKASIKGVIGNIGRDLFESDMAMAQIALMGATAKSVSLKIENSGLAEKIYAFQGRAQSRSADEVRAEIGSMAALGIPALLGASDDAKAIANAVAKFLGQPKALSIDVAAKNAGGIGIPDIATIDNPQKALELVTVKANAN